MDYLAVVSRLVVQNTLQTMQIAKLEGLSANHAIEYAMKSLELMLKHYPAAEQDEFRVEMRALLVEAAE